MSTGDAGNTGGHGATVAGRPFWQRQRPSGMPHQKYRPGGDPGVRLGVGRSWPDREITEAPLWVPVDLRDGNQALVEPMTPERKLRMFELMVRMGYKEIEVGYPAASELDFRFVRVLAERDLIPDDVTIVVFTPAREDAIERTIDSLEGVRSAVVHLCVATAPLWREIVLRRDREELLELVAASARQVEKQSQGRYRFQFSPEAFTSTEVDFAVEVCNLVTGIWEASPERPVVLNLPATVETTGPHHFADRIEYVHRALDRRDGVILSLHPHNDRGTGVAAAELGLLAGAQRVEGCLFGNGERTGNVCLVTLALNLFSRGVDPMIDFSELDHARRVVEECTGIPVHPRHPYGGDLVFTAFSGTHQDAIRKGLDAQLTPAEPGQVKPWQVPYVPVDPADLGRPYDRLIRVNSQSGKSGIAHVLRSVSGLFPPPDLQRDFAAAVQVVAETHGEIPPPVLWTAFRELYLLDEADDRVEEWVAGDDGAYEARLRLGGVPVTTRVSPTDPATAAVELIARATGAAVLVRRTAQQVAEVEGRTVQACYAEVAVGDRTGWGCATSGDSVQSIFLAVLAAHRSLRREPDAAGSGADVVLAALRRHPGRG
ncbi:2-isopropylmalate synthase [Micromonospora rifamycinica]|uniref:2-isopropylmalate synthase n=1 Tax=Micromonospora rifamycinica TaxID=291594 RepID=UPI002E2B616E|nr:2-isopropylmalate synthase [Micromonospora rifamycinica]